VACKLANGLGKKVALIEKKKLGGDCTWFGCIPSKTLIKSAYIAHQIKRVEQFGLKASRPIELNTDNVMAHVRSVVETDAAGHPAQSYEDEGINVFFDSPQFLDNHRIQLSDKVLSAKSFIVCTGSHPFVPDIEGLDSVPYLTNETIFDLDALPKSMIVLGAGPIGIELAASLNRLGVKVTVLLRSSRILKKEDEELSERLAEVLQDEGLEIMTDTKSLSFSGKPGKITAEIERDSTRGSLQAESLLVAVGRRPNLGGLGLDKAGVEHDETGIKADHHLRTTAKNIYACGDVVPPYLFTHIAEYEAVIATTNACFGLPIKSTNYDNVLWCTYTDPELARAGLTEEQAREKYGDGIRVYRWEHKDVDRAKTDLATEGLSKFICDKKGHLLGIHILGHGAAELMHEAQLAKSQGIPFTKIASTIHAYPSYSDGVRQPAKRCYIDMLQDNPFLKTARKLAPKKDKQQE
jgi:pyruvate/2-oxoglutarate dehydrogenase complex dihydrolipoamide dehydrogenase (E3) component